MSERDEKFFQGLNTVKVEDSTTATDIQTLSNPVSLENDNKSVMKAIKLVNDATLRSDGGPIPGTVKIVSTGEQTSNQTQYPLLTPAKGEVWMVCALSSTKQTVTTMNYQFGIEDTVNTLLAYLCDFNITSGVGPINEGGFVTPIFLDENCRLFVNATLIGGSYGSYTADALVVRVR